MESLKYTKKINSFPSDIFTINSTNYEDICKSNDCFEVISDDKPIKFYTDIDIKGLAQEYDDNLLMYPNVLERAKNILKQFYIEFLVVVKR